jgi:glycosyltransferase 2 family protein
MLTRLTRLSGNPWMRAGLLGLVLAFCGYGLHADWPQVTAGLGRLHWYSVALALAAAMAGSVCMMLAWRAILTDLGSPLPLGPAAKISFLAHLAKYLPGAVWSFATQVELGHDRGVPRQRSVASFAISLTVALGAGLAVAAVALPLASPATARDYWWVLAAVPVIGAGLCPPVLGRVIDRGLALVKRPPLERRPSWPGLGRALAWTVAGWLLLGIQVWLVLTSMTGGRGDLLLATGGYALAFCIGLLVVVFPSGIGAREFILVATLATSVPHGAAVAAALVTRVVTTAADLACGGAGLAAGRVGRSRSDLAVAGTAAAQPAPQAVGDRIGTAGPAVRRADRAAS